MRLGQPLPLAVLVEAGVEAGRRRGHHVDPIRSSSNTENLDAVPEVPGRRRTVRTFPAACRLTGGREGRVAAGVTSWLLCPLQQTASPAERRVLK